ncbi:MAG: hypothetical protein M3O07_02860 [Pseudomonadota bacterium]|nr:hypothetical protein [Pseudomonadota bacterium]
MIDVNPVIEETGAYCDAGQHGIYWFLAGNTGGRTTRNCTVPQGVQLIIPVITTFCYPEEGFDDDASCIEYINDALAGYLPEDMTVRLDGVNQPTTDICEIAIAPGQPVPDVEEHCIIRRSASRTLFNFVINQSGFFFSPPGVWRANAARGVWSVIDTATLEPGVHKIRIRAEGQPGAIIPFLNVVYNLTVALPEN